MGFRLHFFITGHTGFKGAWLALLLKARGHVVSGVSLDPEVESLFEVAELGAMFSSDFRFDIRDKHLLEDAVKKTQPDVVIHLAAQPLVRKSYAEPEETFEVNVIGTMNLLSAIQEVKTVKACLVITTDKVYKNIDQLRGYVESDPLGGDDPYSASKGMADLLSQSWAKSFPSVPTAIARAGNVIGGGDVCADRLVPDIVKAYATKQSVTVRNPDSVRPWQHVLDCLNGYLLLVDSLLNGEGVGQWNFGPISDEVVTVGKIVELIKVRWPELVISVGSESNQVHEAKFLLLNSEKSQSLLHWKDRLPFPLSLDWTLDWESRKKSGESALEITMSQIARFESL